MKSKIMPRRLPQLIYCQQGSLFDIPANSFIVHSMLQSKDPKTPKILKQNKSLKQHNPENVYRYANISNKLFDQKSQVHWEVGF